jgi:hypothetical protein
MISHHGRGPIEARLAVCADDDYSRVAKIRERVSLCMPSAIS